MKKRCSWVNIDNKLYVEYHDLEWSVPKHDDKYLYEQLILEMFQAGLSWECILNKRKHFYEAYDNFDIDKVIKYDDKKIDELLNNSKIIRNKLKIKSSINNSIIFKQIQCEFGSFDKYLWSYTDNKIIKECCGIRINSELSDKIAIDLKHRGMKFIGSTIIYSYLQAVGVINAHSKDCYLYKK